MYINPRVLAEHQELHPVLAQITQTFIADYATPLAHAFAVTRSRKWGKSNAQQTPSKGKATPSKGKEKTILPLVPSPVSPNSAHFVFHGRPAGSLEILLNSSSHILSYAPSYDGNVTWEPTQVQISGGSASVPSSSHPSSSHPSSSHPSISHPSSLPPSISGRSRLFRAEPSSAGTVSANMMHKVNLLLYPSRAPI